MRCACALVARFETADFSDCVELYADLLLAQPQSLPIIRMVDLILRDRFGERSRLKIKGRALLIEESTRHPLVAKVSPQARRRIDVTEEAIKEKRR
jgi:hypothetical protein